MAVRDGDKWYHDGRQEPFSIEARNGWYDMARIRPGYIIMREADYLQDRYRDPDVNTECNGDPAQCPTFHSGRFNLRICENMLTINGQNKRNTQISIAPIRIFLH